MHSHRHKCIHSYTNASCVAWSWWPHFLFSPFEHVQLLLSIPWLQCLEHGIEQGEPGGRNVVMCRCAERHWHKSASYSFNWTSSVLVHFWQTSMGITGIWVTLWGTKAFVLLCEKQMLMSWEEDTKRTRIQGLWDVVLPFLRVCSVLQY